MANVVVYLKQILASKYGKDVRQSIHDAINEMNTQIEESDESALKSAEKALESANAAKTSEDNAKEYKELSEEYANAAYVSSTAAKTSEDNALEHANSASSSEDNAKLYAENAKTSENNALEHSNAAKTSEGNAKESEANAKTSEENAETSKTQAVGYADEAKDYKESAETAAANASSVLEECKQIKSEIGSVISYEGSIGFADLPDTSDLKSSFMYNINEKFTTDERFLYPGISYPEGTNVVNTSDGHWDVTQGTYEVDEVLSETSANPVQNKVLTVKFEEISESIPDSAEEILYSNTESEIEATNVQEAIDYLVEHGGGNANFFDGTEEAVEQAIKDGTIQEGMHVVITDDDEDEDFNASAIAYDGEEDNVQDALDAYKMALDAYKMAIAALNSSLTQKQNKTDVSLTTESKEIVGAINALNNSLINKVSKTGDTLTGTLTVTNGSQSAKLFADGEGGTLELIQPTNNRGVQYDVFSGNARMYLYQQNPWAYKNDLVIKDDQIYTQSDFVNGNGVSLNGLKSSLANSERSFTAGLGTKVNVADMIDACFTIQEHGTLTTTAYYGITKITKQYGFDEIYKDSYGAFIVKKRGHYLVNLTLHMDKNFTTTNAIISIHKYSADGSNDILMCEDLFYEAYNLNSRNVNIIIPMEAYDYLKIYCIGRVFGGHISINRIS